MLMSEKDCRFKDGIPTLEKLTNDMIRSLDVELCPGRTQVFLHELLINYVGSEGIEGLDKADRAEITLVYSVLRDYFNDIDRYVFPDSKETDHKKVA